MGTWVAPVLQLRGLYTGVFYWVGTDLNISYYMYTFVTKVQKMRCLSKTLLTQSLAICACLFSSYYVEFEMRQTRHHENDVPKASMLAEACIPNHYGISRVFAFNAGTRCLILAAYWDGRIEIDSGWKLT